MALLPIGGFESLQTAAIVGGIPLIVISAMLAANLAWEDFSLAMKELDWAQARQRATTLPPE